MTEPEHTRQTALLIVKLAELGEKREAAEQPEAEPRPKRKRRSGRIREAFGKAAE